MTSAHLIGSSKVNIGLLQTAARTELLQLLGDPNVKKVMVWDEQLISPMSINTDVQFLRKQGVYKMVRLPVPRLTDQYPEAQEYLFFVRPTLEMVERITEAIRTSTKKQSKKFTVVFVPNKAQHCISRLQEYGFVHDSKAPIEFSIQEYHLDILPLDKEVITLDISTAFKDLYVDNDPTPVYRTARAIAKMQALYGVIPRIIGKGKYAQWVADLLKHTQHELQRSGANSSTQQMAPLIDTLVLIDRTVDLVTPLSTQLTYEGLIDEIYGIKHCSARFPRHMFSEEVQQVPKDSPPPTGPLPISLTSEDPMFSDMRDLNFVGVGHYLSQQAKHITAAFESRKDAKTVSQLKKFVQDLPHMQQQKSGLSKHTTVAELIKGVTDNEAFLKLVHTEQDLRDQDYSDKPHPFVEKLLGNVYEHPIVKVLKLICLQSVTSNGLRPKQLEAYKREVLQAYGYHHLNSLVQLEKSGLLRSQEERATSLLRVQEARGFSALKRQLHLVPTEKDEMNPEDLTYLYSGYAPLSIRLLEQLEKPQGFSSFDELTRQLPGPPAFLRTQRNERRHARRAEYTSTVLVFFLGGVTYAEISALRFLSQREDASVEYLIGTTHLLNGVSLVESVMQETPLFRPQKLWDNQLDDPPPGPPQSR